MTDGPPATCCSPTGWSKTYPDGDVHALNGVSLGVREAEYVAITGPCGCGKSTLLNLLGVLDRPDCGEVYFRGEPLSNGATSTTSAPGRSASCSSRSSCCRR